jgi:hypothetical protein
VKLQVKRIRVFTQMASKNRNNTDKKEFKGINFKK